MSIRSDASSGWPFGSFFSARTRTARPSHTSPRTLTRKFSILTEALGPGSKVSTRVDCWPRQNGVVITTRADSMLRVNSERGSIHRAYAPRGGLGAEQFITLASAESIAGKPALHRAF